MKKNKLFSLVGFIFCISFVFAFFPLYADETISTIADDGNMEYYKPEVKFSPTGAAFIVYQGVNRSTGRSDIYMARMLDGSVTSLGNLSNSGQYSFQPEIDIQGNGHIHVAWLDKSGETHTLKYRMHNGTSWGNVITFGSVNDSSHEAVTDLRIACDENGNVFVCFTQWAPVGVRFFSKYGNTITREDWFIGGRYKHGDIDVDGSYIHGVCQQRDGGDGEYTIQYCRRPNRPGASWEKPVDINFRGTQRPRMSLDVSGVPHVVFFHKVSDSTRILYYTKRSGNGFDSPRRVSSTSDENYHYCDVYAATTDNVIAAMQKGGWQGGNRVNYNWKRNGSWGGYSSFSKSISHRPAEQSIDLAHDSFKAACAFVSGAESIHLIISQEGGGPNNNAPVAAFTFTPETGNAPLKVSFDASGSTDSDGSVTGYSWNFGDGGFGSGQTVTHTFANEGEYTVTLTVTDNSGSTGSTSQVVVVERPNTPPVPSFTFSPVSGLYPLSVNFDASSSYDTDGEVVQYEWDFGGESFGSGRTINHVFDVVGIHQVVLTIYDNNGASARATGTVTVYGLYPPLNLAYTIKENRNLFSVEYVGVVTWNRNPGNADRGANIVQYKIYRKLPGDATYFYYDTVTAQDNNTYHDRLGAASTVYHYAVVAVDDMGRESDLPVINQVREPKTPVFNAGRK